MLLPLLVGSGTFVLSILLYGMAQALIVQVVVRPIRTGEGPAGFWKNVVVMMFVALVTAAAHLIQITLWAVVYWMVGEEKVENFETAFYLSAENYTALGYGDIPLSPQWRLLGPLEAINGLLLFGLSTAVMFAVLSHLISHRLHLDKAR